MTFNSSLNVDLQFDREKYKAEDKQMLRFTLSNELNAPMQVLKWHTPFEGFKNDMFRVEKDGISSVYMDRVVKRGAPKPEDYITIEPKGSISTDVDLSEAYDIFEAGSYRVVFKSSLLDFGIETPEILAKDFIEKREFAPKTVQSNIASFELLESKAPRQFKGIAMELIKELEKISAKQPTFNNCSASRQDELRIALSRAMQIASNSELSLLGIPENKQQLASRFITWFGNYDKQRYSTVADNFKKIWDALSNKGVTFNCDCSEDWYAYVYPSRPYEIFLCNAFWNAPVLGTDSKAGTIVHETSHFYVVASTNDHVYGQSGCQDLASNDPSKAISNADSHEYFAENNPLRDGGSIVPTTILYEHSNYGGRSKFFRGDTPYVGDDFNDITSSLQAPLGYVVVVYEHWKFGGRSKTFMGDTPYVGDDFNDIVSSLRIVPAVILFEHSNFGGRSKTFMGDTPYVGNDFNDIASSLLVPNGFAVTLYEHSNYGGRSKTFMGDTNYLGDDFNDIVSSLRIVPAVTLFEHSNYGGRSKTFIGDTPYVGNDFNDIASSLLVPYRFAVTLYEHSNYGGRSKTFMGDTNYLGDDFNDIVSSLKIVPA